VTLFALARQHRPHHDQAAPKCSVPPYGLKADGGAIVAGALRAHITTVGDRLLVPEDESHKYRLRPGHETAGAGQVQQAEGDDVDHHRCAVPIGGRVAPSFSFCQNCLLPSLHSRPIRIPIGGVNARVRTDQGAIVMAAIAVAVNVAAHCYLRLCRVSKWLEMYCASLWWAFQDARLISYHDSENTQVPGVRKRCD